ncbi:hypothetical protein KKH43_00960 [Patescibacteria group bacterium]|nr:hypothetical protein [Patescibacteria group bacterium]
MCKNPRALVESALATIHLPFVQNCNPDIVGYGVENSEGIIWHSRPEGRPFSIVQCFPNCKHALYPSKYLGSEKIASLKTIDQERILFITIFHCLPFWLGIAMLVELSKFGNNKPGETLHSLLSKLGLKTAIEGAETVLKSTIQAGDAYHIAVEVLMAGFLQHQKGTFSISPFELTALRNLASALASYLAEE